jgi:hypothetical protein
MLTEIGKNPAEMRTGNFLSFTFRVEGRDILWLTTKTDQNGRLANPTTVQTYPFGVTIGTCLVTVVAILRSRHSALQSLRKIHFYGYATVRQLNRRLIPNRLQIQPLKTLNIGDTWSRHRLGFIALLTIAGFIGEFGLRFILHATLGRISSVRARPPALFDKSTRAVKLSNG